MIPSHLSFIEKPQNLRLAGVTLVLLLAALAAGVHVWAEDGDTPIIIADGSLTIESAVPWADFTATRGNTKAHPHTGKSVTQVAIKMGSGNQWTFPFSGQKCSVAVRYASTDITVATGNNGKGLRVTTDFRAFSADAKQPKTKLVHNDSKSKISHVRITRGRQAVLDANASGGTEIVISYK